MGKQQPFNDEELRKEVDAFLSQKKKSQPKSTSSGGSSGTGSLNDITTNPFNSESVESFIGKEAADRIKYEVENPIDLGIKPLALGNTPQSSPTASMSNTGGLFDDIGIMLNGGKFTITEKEEADKLNRIADIYDSVNKNKAIDAARSAPLKEETMTTGGKERKGNYWKEFDAAVASGIDMLGVMAGSIPSAVLDAQIKTSQVGRAGMSALGDWLKSVKKGERGAMSLAPNVNDFDNFWQKLNDISDKEFDAEEWGDFVDKTVGLPEEYNPLSPNNIVVKEYADRAKANSELAYKNYNGGISQAIANGDWATAGRLTSLGVVQSLPIMAGLIASRGAGVSELGSLGIMGLGTTGQTYRELKDENPEINKNLLYLNSVVTGLSEAGTELMGTGQIYNQARRLYMRGAKEEAQEALRTGIRGYLDAGFKKAFVGASALDEGTTEAVNQVVKNAIDKWTGVRPDIDYTEGVLDAFIIGNGAGAAIAAPMYGLNKAVKLVNKNRVNALTQENAQIEPYLTDDTVSPSAKAEILNQVAANNEEINNTIEADVKRAKEVLNPAETEKLTEINNKITAKEAVANNPEMPMPVQESAKLSIAEMEKQADEIVTQAEARKDQLSKLDATVKTASTPEKISKVVSEVQALEGAELDEKYREIIDKAEAKLKTIKAEKPKEGETVNVAKKQLLDELDAELDALKKSVPPALKDNVLFVKPTPDVVAPAEQEPQTKSKGVLDENIYTSPDGEKFDMYIVDGEKGRVNSFDDVRDKSRMTITVKDLSGNSLVNVANAGFWKDSDGKYFSNLTDVNKEYRNKGLATAMYDFAKKNGIDIKSSKTQTEMGNGFANKYFNEEKPYVKDKETLIKPTETKAMEKPTTADVEEQYRPTPKTGKGDTIIWNGKPRKIIGTADFGKGNIKYHIDNGNKGGIWTDFNTLNSDFKKGLNENAVDDDIPQSIEEDEDNLEPTESIIEKPETVNTGTKKGVSLKELEDHFDFSKTHKVGDIVDFISKQSGTTDAEKVLLKKYGERLNLSNEVEFSTTGVIGNSVAAMVTNKSTGKNKLLINPEKTTNPDRNITFQENIIHELTHFVTELDEQNPDSVRFYDDISNLIDVAEPYFNKNKSYFSEKYKGARLNYGFTAVNEFIAEAMSNRSFQAMLSEIPYKGTNKSVWSEYVDKLKDFFSKLLGLSKNSNVLDEAIAIITNNIAWQNDLNAETKAQRAKETKAEMDAILAEETESKPTENEQKPTTPEKENVAEVPVQPETKANSAKNTYTLREKTNPNKYYAQTSPGVFVEVKDASPVNVGVEGDFFVHPAIKGGGFVVTEGTTGSKIESGDTEIEAVNKAAAKVKAYVDKNGEEPFYEMFNKNGAGVVDKNPRYLTGNTTGLKVGDKITYLEKGASQPNQITVDSITESGIVFRDNKSNQLVMSSSFDAVNKRLADNSFKKGWEEPTPEPPKSTVKQKIESIQNEELIAAKKAFLDTFKNLNSGINPETLDKGLKLIAVYTKLGVYKFADIVNDIKADFGDQLSTYFESLKAAYGAYKSLDSTPDEVIDQMDTFGTTRKYKLEDFINQNIDNNERASEPLPVEENAPAVPTGEQPQNVDGVAPNEPVSQLRGTENVASGEIGNETNPEQQAVTAGDTGGSGRANTDAGGNVDGGTTDGNNGGSVPANTKQRKVSVNDQNHVIEPNDIIAPAGEVGKFNANVDAIFMLNKLEAENRNPTPAEKKALAQYVGWGGLSRYLSYSGTSRDDDMAVSAFMKGEDVMLYKNGSYTRSEIKFSEKGPVDLSKYNSSSELVNSIRTELAREGYSISPDAIRAPMLKNMISPEEYQAAQTSTISAHFTDRRVVEKMWEVVNRLGFKGGKVLESSAGVGNILGLMPSNLRTNTDVTGYELDKLTGEILKKLYPQSKIVIDGFENAKIPLNSQDLVITNVPFGQNAPYDRFYPELSKFSLHNYFIGKNLKMLKPGGIGVMISSSSTMDAGASARFREWITSPNGGNSVLVGAIRLPNNAFAENAGTQVTADVLIFQKRGVNENPDIAQDFRYSKFLKEGNDRAGDTVKIEVNEYYINNPQQMLGEMMTAADAGSGALYGNGSASTLVAPEGFNMTSALNDAIDNLPYNIMDENTSSVAETVEEETITAMDKKEGSLFVKDGRIYQVSNGTGTSVQLEPKQATMAKDYVAVKSDLLNLIELEQTVNANEVDIENNRAELNKKYDAFVKKHGNINGRNAAFIEDLDVDFPIATALENIKRSLEKVGTSGRERIVQEITKGEILNKRINFPRVEPTTAKDLQDAIDISLNYKNGINVNYISKLIGETPEIVEQRLLSEDLAYENPDTGLLEAPDEYLSGYVRDKLKKAEIALENDPKYAKNVEELRKIIPEDIPSSLIQYTLGAGWIPTSVYSEFAESILDTPVTVNYMESAGKFSAKANSRYGAKVKTTYAAGGKDAMDILNATLNNSQITVTETVMDGDGKKRTVKNVEKTAAAQAMQEQMQDEFQAWVRQNEAVALETERVYNDIFNGQVLRDYRTPDFDHYPGASTTIKLRQHQKRAVSRGLSESTLNAHQVGSGKTFTIITTAMEMRRLGLAKKPMIVVQNATRGQFVSSFRLLYPSAKILVPSDKELSADGRKRFFAKIATGDWDAVLIPQSQLSMIPDDPTRQQAYIMEQIEEMKVALMDMDKYSNPFEYRQLEKQIKDLNEEYEVLENPDGEAAQKKRGGKSEAKQIADKSLSIEAGIRKALDRKTDNIFNFEQLGVDALLIDEAHAYKRLGFQTAMKNIKGIDTSKSKRSQSVLLKTRWVQEKTGGKNVLFYTGTPISNTMAEAWTMLKYVRPDILDRLGIQYFDQFAKTFGQVVPSLEQTGGGTFKVQNRFAKFQNLPEFITAFRAATDVVLSEDVIEFQQEDTLPKLTGGKINQQVVKQSPELKKQIKVFRDTLEWFANLSGKEKKENSHIPLVIFNKAKQASIDLRLLDPTNVDSPESKVNQAIKNILEVYKNPDGESARVQMIFSDMYQSPEPKFQFLDDDNMIPNPAYGKDRFNLFNDIKAKLIAGGVKESEIAILTEPKYDKAERKEQLFADANSGKIRIMMGSTERMGVGVNAQQKMRALHHLDAPARPMDFEQRNGRIIRQGNENKIVDVYAYGVEKTLDSSAFQRLSTKQQFINQIMKGESVDRVTEDPADEAQLTFDEMMAQLSDSPFAMQKLMVDNQIRKEKTKRENFQGKQITINSKLRNTRSALSNAKSSLVDDERYAGIVSEKFKDGNVTNVIASGVTYTEEFGKAINGYIDMLKEKWNDSPTSFAKGYVKINDVTIELEIAAEKRMSDKTNLMVEFPSITYTAPEIGVTSNGWGNGIEINTGGGLMTSLRSQLNKVLEEPAKQREHISNLETDLAELNRTVNDTFDDSKLKSLEAEAKKLEEQMIAEGNKKKSEDDDTDPDGGGSGIDYILDQSNVAPVINALDRLKINTSGKMLSSVVPIAPALWNGAIETMKAVIKATNSIQKGIRVGAKYIINQGGSRAQAEDFKQTINNMYGPGTPMALKLETMANKIRDGKIMLTEKVTELNNDTDHNVIKSRLVDVMAEARKTQLIKTGIAKADNAAVAIGAVSAIKDLETAKDAIEKVLDFLDNVGYNSAIRYAKAAHDRLKQIATRNKMALSPTSRKLSQLDPRTLTPAELNDYLELAPVLVSQLDGKDAGLVPDNDIAIFLDQVKARQDEEIKAKLMARYSKLGLEADMTVDEMKELINESKEETDANEQSMAPDVFASRENKKREILTAVLEINRDELYKKIDIPADKKLLTDGLLNIDESMLSTGDIVRLNQIVANIVANDIYTGAGYFSKVSQGISQIKKYRGLVERLGGFRPITQDSFLKDRLKGSRLNALSLTDKYLHLNTFEEIGRATDEMLSYPIGNGYANQKTELKSIMDGLEKVIKENGLNKDAKAMYKIGVYGDINSYIVGDKRTREEQFADNVGLFLQTVENLANSKDRYEKSVYKVISEIADEIQGATQPGDLANFLTGPETKVYDYIRETGNNNFNRLYENNEMYGSAPMKEKANYVHRRYVPLRDGEVKIDLIGDEPIAASANGVLGQSGTKQDVVVKKRLPKGKVIDYNIYKSFRLGLNESLNDIYTLGDRIKADFILKSPAFEEALSVGNDSGKRNLNILRDSIKQMVNLQRGISKVDMDMYGGAAKVMNFFRQTFYSSAVGTITAAVPQYISSAMFALAKLNHPSSYIQSMWLFGHDTWLAKLAGKNTDLAKRLIQVAGGGTQNRDLQGDQQLDDVANNMSENLIGRYVSPKISESIDWMNDKLFASLKYGDRLTSLHSWMAGYIDNLIDQGVIKKASEFDFKMLEEHLANPNATAAVAGETMVTLSNNESDASRKANMFVNKTITQEWINDVLYPVKKFAVAMNNKLWLGIRNVSEWDGGQGDGARLIVGALASMAVYGAIRDFIINKGFDAIGGAITGALGLGDEDDQDKEEQERLKMTDEQFAEYKSDRLMYKFGSDVISDALLGGQNVAVEKGIKNTINFLWSGFGDKIQEERKAEKKYAPKNAFYVSNGVASMAGVYGDAAGIFLDLGSDQKSPLNVLLDINKEVDAKEEAKARRAIFSVGLPLTTNFLLPSADAERINNRIKRRVEWVDEKYRDITLKDRANKSYKKYNSEEDDQSSVDF